MKTQNCGFWTFYFKLVILVLICWLTSCVACKRQTCGWISPASSLRFEHQLGLDQLVGHWPQVPSPMTKSRPGNIVGVWSQTSKCRQDSCLFQTKNISIRIKKPIWPIGHLNHEQLSFIPIFWSAKTRFSKYLAKIFFSESDFDQFQTEN